MAEFVGRVGERALLRARLEDARRGQGRLVLIAGEPGIGKTRLAEEVARDAEGDGVRLGWGRASDDAGAPPYWVFHQVLRSLGHDLPAVFTGGRESARSRFDAFETLAGMLHRAAGPHGVLAVLDDLQWADDAALALLVHLARGMDRSRLLVLATYRDTEITGRPALSAALAALAREPVLTRIRLEGLTPGEVARQLGVVRGEPVSRELAAMISGRTGGNPFFVAQVGGRPGEIVPEVVVDAVRARLAHLSPSCQALVASAAVLGAELTPAALAEVTGRPLGDVLADLDEAAAAGMLVTGAAGLRFGHDLIRESARLDLSTAARLTAHARMATWLEARPDAAARAAEIAHHWRESLPLGDVSHAAAWAERAADEALEQFAWERAAALYEAALDTGASPAAVDRARLLRQAAVAALRGGDLTGCSRLLAAAAKAARAASDSRALAEVALATEGVSDPWGSFRGGPLAEEALAALPVGDDPLRARLLALRAGEAGFSGGPEPERISAEALAMADRLQDTRALRSALRARQMTRSGPDGVHERFALGERMLALGLAEEDDDTALWGRLWRFDALAMLGRLDAAEAEVPLIRTLAERARRPLARWHHLRAKAAIDISRGRFDEAIAATRESLALVTGRTHEHASIRGVPTVVLAMIGGFTGRAGLVTDSMVEVFDRAVPQFAMVLLARHALQLGQPERARRWYRAAPAVDEVPVPATLPALAAYIDMGAEFGPPETVAAAARRLRPYADLFITGGAGVLLVLGSARTHLGMADAATGHLDEAVPQLRRGIEANDRAGTRPFAAAARFELAKVLARRRRPGDADEAVALATSVAHTAERLGMAPLHRQATELAGWLRGDRPGPLTRREREVAALVAQGLTNKQIAALMHIAERTAENHVQHILTKLGLANRTLIAGWARTGLLGQGPS